MWQAELETLVKTVGAKSPAFALATILKFRRKHRGVPIHKLLRHAADVVEKEGYDV